MKLKAKDFLNSFESEETKPLSNYQLQRIALLEQIKVLGMQKKKLEAGQDVLLDISGWNMSTIEVPKDVTGGAAASSE